MLIQTKAFGEITIEDDKIITFPGGVIGFPDLIRFTMIHDSDGGNETIHWLQSLEEPGFAMPVLDPLLVKADYNPEINDEFLHPLGVIEELLVLVTVTVPQDLTKMTVNLKGPIIINAGERKACQVIVEGEDNPVKFPIYDILQARKAGE